MNMVGNVEKDLDQTTESSFWPSPYKPTITKSANKSGGSATSLPYEPSKTSEAGGIDLPNSALFLPCHYFDYAAGSSTGG